MWPDWLGAGYILTCRDAPRYRTRWLQRFRGRGGDRILSAERALDQFTKVADSKAARFRGAPQSARTCPASVLAAHGLEHELRWGDRTRVRAQRALQLPCSRRRDLGMERPRGRSEFAKTDLPGRSSLKFAHVLMRIHATIRSLACCSELSRAACSVKHLCVINLSE